MKKTFIASMLVLAASVASAVELGVTAARDYSGADRSSYGVTLGQKYGAVGVTAGFDRTDTGVRQDRYTVVGSYDLTKIGPVTVSAKAGGAYLDNTGGNTGYAALVGVGATIPVTKSVAATVDLTNQIGQDRVQSFDGNRITAGLKFSF